MKPAVTLERLHQLLDYDPATGIFTWKVATSNRVKVGARAGGAAANGHRQIGIDGRLYREHRLAWFMMHGVWPTHEVDHQDGQANQNRITNLRDIPHAKNMLNRKLNSNNKLGIKGVTMQGSRFRADISIEKKQVCLGVFATKERAAEAYRAASVKHHGVYARS